MMLNKYKNKFINDNLQTETWPHPYQTLSLESNRKRIIELTCHFSLTVHKQRDRKAFIRCLQTDRTTLYLLTSVMAITGRNWLMINHHHMSKSTLWDGGFSLTGRLRLQASGLRCRDDPSHITWSVLANLTSLVVHQAKELPSSFAACGLHKEEVLEEECYSLWPQHILNILVTQSGLSYHFCLAKFLNLHSLTPRKKRSVSFLVGFLWE